jgi:ankyrin
MNIFEAVREGREETICSLISADPTLLEKAEEGGGDTPLLVAVEHGKADMVKLLLKLGADIDGDGPKGETALMRAITKGNEEVLLLLLGHGASADLADDAGKTPLMWASIKGHLGLVRLVFDSMVREGLEWGLNRRADGGQTALHYAAEGGYFEVVAYLLCKEARADIEEASGKTPLMLACAKSPVEILVLLLDAREGQGLEEQDIDGQKTLHLAAAGGNKAVVAFLLRNGADVISRDAAGVTPLMLACKKGHVEVVKMLLEARNGKGLQEWDGGGWRALHFAAYGGNINVVKVLLSEGADVSSRDADGVTPLMLACKKGHLEVVQVLLEATEGQGLEEITDAEWTVMHYSAYGGHKDVVAFLLTKGVSASSRSDDDMTPLMWACMRGHLEVVQMLLGAREGQGMQETDEQGRTVLHHAATGGNKEMVAFLLNKRAQANIKDAYGLTPLMVACEGDEDGVEVVQMLFDASEGQGLEDRDYCGQTALHIAAREGNTRVAAFLLSKGAHANIKDTDEETPLVSTSSYGPIELVQLLLRHADGQWVNERNQSEGKTALHKAVVTGDKRRKVVRALLLAGADPMMADNEGITPRQFTEQGDRHSACLDVFEVSFHVPVYDVYDAFAPCGMALAPRGTSHSLLVHVT